MDDIIIVPVERNSNSLQLAVLTDSVVGRQSAGKNRKTVTTVSEGIYNVLDTQIVGETMWACISENVWVMVDDESATMFEEIANISDEIDDEVAETDDNIGELGEANIVDVFESGEISTTIEPVEDVIVTDRKFQVGSTVTIRSFATKYFNGNTISDYVKNLKRLYIVRIDKSDGSVMLSTSRHQKDSIGRLHLSDIVKIC